MIARHTLDRFFELIDFPRGTAGYERWVTPDGLKEADWIDVIREHPFYLAMDENLDSEGELPYLQQIFAANGLELTFGDDWLEAQGRRESFSDIPTLIQAANRVADQRFSFRLDRATEGTDTPAYLAADWEVVEAELPHFVAERFERA